MQRFWIQLHNNKAHGVGCFRLGNNPKLKSKTFFFSLFFLSFQFLDAFSFKSNAYLWIFHVSFNMTFPWMFRSWAVNTLDVPGHIFWDPVVADRNRFLISDDSLEFDQTWPAANCIEVFFIYLKKKVCLLYLTFNEYWFSLFGRHAQPYALWLMFVWLFVCCNLLLYKMAHPQNISCSWSEKGKLIILS